MNTLSDHKLLYCPVINFGCQLKLHNILLLFIHLRRVGLQEVGTTSEVRPYIFTVDNGFARWLQEVLSAGLLYVKNQYTFIKWQQLPAVLSMVGLASQ